MYSAQKEWYPPFSMARKKPRPRLRSTRASSSIYGRRLERPLSLRLKEFIVKALHEIEIEVAPAELPHNLPVDLSKLVTVGDHITAAQIPLPPSASLITEPEEILVSVTEFKEEKEEITPAPETVITTAKAEVGEASEAAPAEKPAQSGKAEKKDH